MCSQLHNNHRQTHMRRENEKNGLRKIDKQTPGQQEAAVPEVAATAKAPSVRVSGNLLWLFALPLDRS